MVNLYPLKFEPILKPLLWGGSRIMQFKDQNATAGDKIGESWEVSGIKGSESVVKDGPLAGTPLTQILKDYRELFVGENVYNRYGDSFPLLLKFIDAHDDLSIQVHPNDELARKRHQTNGKTEMWYVLDASPEAYLYSGFNRNTNREEVLAYTKKGEIMSLLNKEMVAPGHVYFIPAGRVHSLGKGVLVAEVQQTSDVTYRVWDYNRKDFNGEPRQLHTELALDAFDYKKKQVYRTNYKQKPNSRVTLKQCSYFTQNLIEADTVMNFDYGGLDSFVIWMCIGGNAVYASQRHNKGYIKQGETILFPACDKPAAFIPACDNVKILEVYIQ